MKGTDLLVFGATGQVARALAELAPQARFLGRAEADLTKAALCRRAIETYRPKAVINAAAFTAVDLAETQEAEANLVNAQAPGAMAEACAALDIPLVHISTDYVFAGGGTNPHSPHDITAPINAYGRSKRAGEEAIQNANGVHAILRTSWVFSSHGSNFVKSMLRLAKNHEKLSIVNDQIGGPTPASAIAKACLVMAGDLADNPHKSGIYHFSGAPDVSWFDFAEAIFAKAGKSVELCGISTSDYPTPAKRPLNSRLDCATSLTSFGLERPDWRQALRDTLGALGEKRS